MPIAAKLAAVHHAISLFKEKYGRGRASIALLAVTKKQSADKIRAAYAAGQRAFGESYLQEALPKMAELADLADIEWHFIGPIQSNKTRKIAEHFHWVQSVDSYKIAERLNSQRPPELPPLNICIEINVSGEASKSGVKPEDAARLIAACADLPQLAVRGLMSIPAPVTSLDAARKQFHLLHHLFQQLNHAGAHLDTLSMGMSDDFEAAIAEGSTLVRIGSVIFGERS
jgi:pyridoxal phosphate enzyme (YggS family)